MHGLLNEYVLPERLLVTGPNDPGHKGGLFEVNFRQGHIRAIAAGDYRGMVRAGGQYFVALPNGIVRYSQTFDMLQFKDIGDMDIHGLAIWQEQWLFAVETARNAIGVYDLASLTRTGEIRFHAADVDENHLNDVSIVNDVLYVSMFSPNGQWQQLVAEPAGAVLSIPLGDVDFTTGRAMQQAKVARDRLYMPHSVQFHENQLVYCESLRFCTVLNSEEIIEQQGFTRGLGFYQDTVFVGQSAMRHLSRVYGKRHVSMDSGIYVYRRNHRQQRFISLPVRQVYQILVEGDLAARDMVEFAVADDSGLIEAGEWHEPEAYRWMAQEEVRFVLSTEYAARYRLVLDVSNGYPGDYGMSILYQSHTVADVTIRGRGMFRVECSLDLPQGRSIFVVRVPFLWRPTDFLGSADRRQLGLALKRAWLTPDAEAFVTAAPNG